MKIYFKNLDALRFLAFLSVFVSHISLFLGYQSRGGFFERYKGIFFVHGDLGVSFFFVLSGFLITFFIFAEKDKKGKISFSTFYLKKILRIFPTYLLVVFLGFFLIYPLALKSGLFFPFSSIAPVSSLPWYLFFMVNFKMAFFGVSSLVLAVLWAVSVEIQFYLVWPFLVSLFSFKNILRVSSFLILISFGYRILHYDNYNIIKYSTFSVMSDLAIGAILAYITLFSNKIKNWAKDMSRGMIVLIYLIGISLIFLRSFLSDISTGIVYRIIYTLLPVIFSVFFAFVILEQNEAESSFVKFGRFKLFNYLGVRSYGLYCYHLVALFFVLYFFGKFGAPNPYSNLWLFGIEIIAVFLLTVLFATLSYTYFEKKFLLLKEKFKAKNE